jgi:hypothetical protein
MKIFAAFAAMLLFSGTALAQRTVVSGTVKDTNGTPYSGGTLVVTLSLPLGSSGATLNGVQIAGSTQRVTLDATGSFLMQLPDNAVVLPGGTQWTFNINMSPGVAPPLGTGPQSCSATLTITGASQSVSGSLSACPTLTNLSSGATQVATLPATCVTGNLYQLPNGQIYACSAGNVLLPVSTPGGASTSGLTQNGLMAEYRLLPTENPCAAVDYSGNGNTATGCSSTAPTIIPNSGGFNTSGTSVQFISLPAALNSALTIIVYAGSQFVSEANPVQSIIQGNGNGSTGNAIGIMLTKDCFGTNGSTANCPFNDQHISSYGNNAYKSQVKATFNGTGSIALTMGAVDHIYLNGVDPETFNGHFSPLAASAGLQTVGNYQLGGAATSNGSNVGNITAFVGQIYYAAFWNRVLNPGEVAASADFIQRAMIQRGVPPQLGGTNFLLTSPIGGDGISYLVGDGDSLTGLNNNDSYLAHLTLNQTYNIVNLGVLGLTLSNMLVPNAPQSVDPMFRPVAERNTVIIWGGTNDACTTALLCATLNGKLKAYCNARHTVGWKCVVGSMISRTGNDAGKNFYDTEIRKTWATYADGFADIASDPNLGADGASASGVYFTDGIHVSTLGIINDETPIFQRAVNRLYGNRDFSSATVYASPAAAAVATTAGSEATNTVTLTFAATPANCQVGNTITVAGTTPAGYSGNFTILTRSATQVTYFTTSGLGAITVQGTGVCPQQQDADVYSILNFGAGNYTLETCMGFTGQNLYIRNINAVASTLMPFSAETITGAGATPTTLAANTTAILQSQLVSSAAAGCNWVRLQ